jgi:hypothetical protein
MSKISNRFHSTDILASQFFEKAEALCTEVEPIRVLKSRTYKVGDANVLIRAAMEGKTGKYFFGLNYITAEELANLDNPFIAFICGSVERTVVLPAKLLFQHFPQISHDRNGEYKITIDKDLNLVLKGKGKRIDCSPFINGWKVALVHGSFFETVKSNLLTSQSFAQVLNEQLRFIMPTSLQHALHFQHS